MKRKLLALGAVIFSIVGFAIAQSYTRMPYVAMVLSTIDSTVIGATTPASAAFTIATATTYFQGALHGNATTATALAAFPAQCAVDQAALGIAANGAANCRPIPVIYSGNIAGCDTPAGTYQQCSQTITLNGTFSSGAYAPFCQGFGFNHSVGSDASGILYVTASTTHTITVVTQSNSGNDFRYTTIYCEGHLY